MIVVAVMAPVSVAAPVALMRLVVIVTFAAVWPL